MKNLFAAKISKVFIAFLTSCLLLLALSCAAAAAEPKQFSDLPNSHWAYTSIMRLASRGAVSGLPDGTFAPGRSITRAELVKLVVGALLSLPEAPPPGQHWAANIIKEAESNSLLEAGEFAPDTWNKPINRQEIAKILVRAAQYVQKEEAIANTASFTAKIKDFTAINKSYQTYVAQAYAKGIVGGYPDGSFGGDKQATRAEACTMVVRLLDPSYRLGYTQASLYDIIGSVNGENIYRYEYDYYFNTIFDRYYSEYYDSLLQYEGVDLLNEVSALEWLGNMETWAWESVVQAALIRQVAFKEYQISLEPSYYENLLSPGTALSISTNRLYTLLYPFIEKEARAAKGIGEMPAKEYYLEDPSAWDCRKVAHIIITAQQMQDEAVEGGKELTAEEADKAAKKRAQDIIAQLAKGEDFAKLAAQYSADGTARFGGEMDLYFNIAGNGVGESAAFDPLFSEGAFLLKKIGDFSKEPVKSSYGYHIIKLLDKKEGYEAVKAYVLDSLQEMDSNEIGGYFQNKMEKLQESAVIERKFKFKYNIE